MSDGARFGGLRVGDGTTLLVSALLTGAFCVIFSAVVAVLTDVLSMWAILALSAVSGFGGRIFAYLVLERRRE